MKKLTKTALAFAVVTITMNSALAEKIYAGSSTGSYTNDFCPQVASALKAGYFEHACTTSAGSGANVESVLASPVDVALGQFDIVAAAADENPGKLVVVDPGLGLECLYAVTSQSHITTLSGLSPRMPVALPSEKSGSTATFRYLQDLDESLAGLRKISYQDNALAAVNSVINGSADLAFFVQFANTNNDVFKAINEAELNFIPVINRKILRREVAGVKVYQPQEVVVTPTGLLGMLKGDAPSTISTTCTPVVVFTGAPSLFEEGSNERQDQDELVKLLTKVTPPSGGDWKDTFANTVSLGKDKLQSLMDKVSN